MWQLFRGLYEKDQWQEGFRLVVKTSDWPLLIGVHCSEVVVRTGCTCIWIEEKIKFKTLQKNFISWFPPKKIESNS
jgi:hypothetical protein